MKSNGSWNRATDEVPPGAKSKGLKLLDASTPFASLRVTVRYERERDARFFAGRRALFFAPPVRRAPFFAGTFAPFSRASDKPIAIACARLLTRPPRPPLLRRSVPFFRRRIALSTLLLAALPYRRRPLVLMSPPVQG